MRGADTSYREADVTWQEQGACRGGDDTLFFHPEGERGSTRRRRAELAKAICRTCPVMETCRAESLANREPYGVWGGYSEDERHRVLDGRSPDAPPPRAIDSAARDIAPPLVLTRDDIPRHHKGSRINAEHAVVHVEALVDAGYSPAEIARTAGVFPGSIRALLDGAERVTQRTEALVLAVQPQGQEVAA